MTEFQIPDLLHKAGLRVTKTRQAVLDELVSAGEQAISSAEIEQNLSGIDRITLYRILKVYEEKGLIHSVADGTGKTKYALCHEECSDGSHQHDHLHFHCRICNSTTCLEQNLPSAIQVPSGYLVEDIQLILSGICKDCQ